MIKIPPPMQEIQERHIPSLGGGGSSREGNSNPLQYSCLENPMDRGAWQAMVHGVINGQTQLSTHIAHKRKEGI